jgi:hypothetical protein
MYNMKLIKYNSIHFNSVHLLRSLTTAEEQITGNTKIKNKMKHNKIQLKTKR